LDQILKTRNISHPNSSVISIQRFCFWISFVRKVYLDLREIWRAPHHGITIYFVLHLASEPQASVFLIFPFKETWHTIPIVQFPAERRPKLIHSGDLFIVPSLQSACINVFGKAAILGIYLNVLGVLVRNSVRSFFGDVSTYEWEILLQITL